MKTNRLLLLFLALGLLITVVATSHSTQSEKNLELLFSLSWSDSRTPQIRGGENEQTIQGPSAVALDKDSRIWILDNLDNKLHGYDLDGQLVDNIELLNRHYNLVAVADDGCFALLSFHLRQIDIIGANGNLKNTLELPIHLQMIRNMGFNSSGELELENAYGERFSLGSLENPKATREVLLARKMGPIGSSCECGIQVKDNKAVIQRWQEPWGLSDGRPHQAETFELELNVRGSVRFAGACHQDRVLLDVERVPAGSRVETVREIVRVEKGKPLVSWQLPRGWLYVPHGRYASNKNETVVIHPMPEGLQVWRFERNWSDR
jgi:hypothetical protein